MSSRLQVIELLPALRALPPKFEVTAALRPTLSKNTKLEVGSDRPEMGKIVSSWLPKPLTGMSNRTVEP